MPSLFWGIWSLLQSVDWLYHLEGVSQKIHFSKANLLSYKDEIFLYDPLKEIS